MEFGRLESASCSSWSTDVGTGSRDGCCPTSFRGPKKKGCMGTRSYCVSQRRNNGQVNANATPVGDASAAQTLGPVTVHWPTERSRTVHFSMFSPLSHFRDKDAVWGSVCW